MGADLHRPQHHKARQGDLRAPLKILTPSRRYLDGLLVDDVDEAFASFLSEGREALQPPFDIAIGRCTRIRDPFGNEVVIVDQSKGGIRRFAPGLDGSFSERCDVH